jgi:hypothetical protein
VQASSDERVLDLVAEWVQVAETYRSLALAALARCHRLTKDLERKEASNLGLREELRRYTATAVLESVR